MLIVVDRGFGNFLKLISQKRAKNANLIKTKNEGQKISLIFKRQKILNEFEG